MANLLFAESKYPLSKLIEDIDLGEIALPDIQRPFVWPNAKVRDLLDSMYRGYPVGYFLFWACPSDQGGTRSIGANPKQRSPRLLVVDGQQRLTSLYAVLKSTPVIRETFEQEQICIAFNPLDERFEVADAAIKRDPTFIANVSEIWAAGQTPSRFRREFVDRLRGKRDLTDDEIERIETAIDKLHALQTYPFTTLELSASVGEEQVSDVFVRINSQGKQLNQTDFILTLMSVFWEDGRRELERFCADSRKPSSTSASPFNYFIEPDPDQLLRVAVGLGFRRARMKYVYSILRGKDLETEQFSVGLRDKHFSVLREAQGAALDLTNWHEFLKCAQEAGYIGKNVISSQNALLYGYIQYLIGRRDYRIPNQDLRNLIARWFFMTSITGRYTTSPETAMERDLNDLRSLATPDDFRRHLDRTIASNFTDDFWSITLPDRLATSSSRSPELFAYYAALNLLDARGLFSRIKVADLLNPAVKAKKSALERHHLFPKNHLKNAHGITTLRDTNQIANYALVEWSDNIDISDEPPAKYFPVYRSRFDDETMRKMMYWHALPLNWESMPYSVFLVERRKLMARVIRDGYESLTRAMATKAA